MCVRVQSSVVKVGAWGGDTGSACYDITVAPQRLESITIRSGKVIDSIAFAFRDRDGKLHTAGPWGGAGGVDHNTITLEPSEYITEVAWSLGSFELEKVDCCVTSLRFVTNQQRTYGPFGNGLGTHHRIPVIDGGSVVGMFARAGKFIDAVGFYVLPNGVVQDSKGSN
ncbi:hypothetical protein HU200_034952 [Digitaria exilis]|uniref:Jacalin-type lectin domain-containing protein n=1 Tax=Digitaria exilis TaxID=1010633 RepID=A0A835BID4_9POAL|nr:hypothetical protein HU200_034952 [Digitaria exilis]